VDAGKSAEKSGFRNGPRIDAIKFLPAVAQNLRSALIDLKGTGFWKKDGAIQQTHDVRFRIRRRRELRIRAEASRRILPETGTRRETYGPRGRRKNLGGSRREASGRAVPPLKVTP